jgi:hypothetical protein
MREVARILKPGGRLSVSDIALKKPLPPEIRDDLFAYVGCIAGAISIDDYLRELKIAGFSEVQVIDTRKDLNAYGEVEGQAACCPPPALESSLPLADVTECSSGSNSIHGGFAELLKKIDLNEYAASVHVYAIKP